MGIDHWIENGYGDRELEDERLSDGRSPDRCTAVLSAPCTACGVHIPEIHFADGRRSYAELIVSTPDGIRHRVCPDREDDLRHDADLT